MLQTPHGLMNILAEADRGTSSVKRFLLKLRAYAAYWEEGRYKTKFGIERFRVLIVTTTPERAENLRAAAEIEELRRLRTLFLFADSRALSFAAPTTIFKKSGRCPATASITLSSVVDARRAGR